VLKPLLLIVVMVAIAACRQPTVIEISRIQHVENGLLPAINKTLTGCEPLLFVVSFE